MTSFMLGIAALVILQLPYKSISEMWGSLGRKSKELDFDFTFNNQTPLTMKEAIVDPDLNVTIHDTAIPVPQPGQVLIRVVVSGTNPKDWKMPRLFQKVPSNPGDDIAGYVESVGEGVVGFRKGDKVAAFHEMTKAGGSFAEYAIAWEHTTFHVPEKTSFEG
jgi:NADPH:quinone reductase and related Zn-dependent oxidoreductases